MDYSRPKKDLTLETYTEPLVQLAFAAYEKIRYCDDVPLGMAQTRLTLARRAPDASRLAWARRVLADLGDREPQTWPEVYAREQVLLHQQPRRELLLQAIRIGALGITAIPNEVFAITGLKLKAQSPLVPTMNIELANGAEGYLPPPEQHRLGGYTTWAARSAGLEVQAEPQIVQSVLGLLERVSGKPRRPRIDPPAPYAQAVLKSRPVFYWRLSEFQGVAAGDATGQGHQGTFEGGVALYLDGPASPGFCGPSQVNRAVHLAGGRIRTPLADHGDRYSVELWFCNLLPADAREVAGHLFSRGFDQMMGRAATGGEHLGLGGTRLAPGRLVFYSGAAPQSGDTLTGRTTIVPGSWYHLVLVRDGRQARVYLNGDTAPELAGELAPQKPVDWLFFGGRNDDYANFEGKLDEVAFYGRALGVDEIARHYAAAGIAP